jgi:hypothetical protein
MDRAKLLAMLEARSDELQRMADAHLAVQNAAISAFHTEIAVHLLDYNRRAAHASAFADDLVNHGTATELAACHATVIGELESLAAEKKAIEVCVCIVVGGGAKKYKYKYKYKYKIYL